LKKLYEIGVLRLDPEARVLTQGGDPVALGARGVAVLTALVSRANEYVPKAEIMDAAWPSLVVEEANLAVQISAIRRTLASVGGEGWIETLARRGYRFVGPVTEISGGRSEPPVVTDRTRSNLPQVLTSFVGREREIAEIKRLLPTTRLLTLTGTGGIGKTRLAVQAAAEVLDAYRDGVWFIDLAPLTDPARVASALAQVLGVTETAGQPLLRTLCEYLRAKELLLVLDNCEHVLGASADLVDAVLRDTARVSVVATSRESLRVATERTYPLGVLPLPDPKAATASIARSDAVQLFVDRARQHRPRFDLEGPHARAVAEICVRLDGLPLALELAAARVAVLPVEDIVRLLDQRFRLLTRGSRGELPRQQTLRAMLDWSYELLDAPERQLFSTLSVFAGGWTIAAAEAVGAGGPIAKDDVVYLLIALIEKSLVVADEDGDRYRMLETVRDYARERLDKSGPAQTVRERHRDYFLALAEEAEPNLSGAEQSALLQRLQTEHENLRSALQWSLADDESAAGLRLCGALQQFWGTRGHLSEGRDWCARVLAKTNSADRSQDRAKVLGAAGLLAFFQADFAAALAQLEESLAIRRQLGDQRGIAIALNNLGNIATDQGDYSLAKALFEETLAIRRERGDRQGIATTLGNLGTVARQLGDLSTSRALQEDSLAIRRELGDQWGIGATLNNLGNVALDQSDFASAQAMFNECLAIMRDLGDRSAIAHALNNLGDVALDQGDVASARALNEESLTIRRDLGDKRGIALTLDGLAGANAAFGSLLPAARIWGAAERLREEIGSPLPSGARSRYDRRLAVARAALGHDSAFDRAWKEGRALTLERAVEIALEEPAVPR
jgi:predicted ATPase/DNA-binding winged helix-turn-helix (wHTH) protein